MGASVGLQEGLEKTYAWIYQQIKEGKQDASLNILKKQGVNLFHWRLLNVNIIIPLGGLGKRFLDSVIDLPKPLISLFLKPIIFWLLDNLTVYKNDNVI